MVCEVREKTSDTLTNSEACPVSDDAIPNPILEISKTEFMELLDYADDHRIQKNLNNGPTSLLLAEITSGSVQVIKIVCKRTNVLTRFFCETCGLVAQYPGPGLSSVDGSELESFDSAVGINCAACTESLRKEGKIGGNSWA